MFDIDVHIDFDRFVRRLNLDRWRASGNQKHQNYYHSKSIHYFTSSLFPEYILASCPEYILNGFTKGRRF